MRRTKRMGQLLDGFSRSTSVVPISPWADMPENLCSSRTPLPSPPPRTASPGHIAYGWIRKGNSKGELVPEKANVVARLFQDFMSGESAYSNAKTSTSSESC